MQVKYGEVLPGDDVLDTIVHEIENLGEQEARIMVGQLREGAEFTFFKLGGVLNLIRTNHWHQRKRPGWAR
jgi:hypothetical protein